MSLSGRMPLVTSKEMGKLLMRDGFEAKSQKGSHVKYVHPDRGNIAIVPEAKGRPLANGTTKSIISQAGWTREQFEAMARGKRAPGRDGLD